MIPRSRRLRFSGGIQNEGLHVLAVLVLAVAATPLVAVAVGELEFDDLMLPIREDGFPRRCVAVHAFRLRPRKTLLGGTHAPVARAEHTPAGFLPRGHMRVAAAAGIAVACGVVVQEILIRPLRPHANLIDGGLGGHAELYRILPAIFDGERLHMGDFAPATPLQRPSTMPKTSLWPDRRFVARD